MFVTGADDLMELSTSMVVMPKTTVVSVKAIVWIVGIAGKNRD